MLSILIASALTAGPAPEVLTKGDADLVKPGSRITLKGTVERIELRKASGCALVLDDGTEVWLTYREPSAEWLAVVGQFVSVDTELAKQSSESPESLAALHLVKPGKPSAQARALASLANRTVRLVGLADDAKAGAVLMVDGAPVYVDGRGDWPPALKGKRVALGGRLIQREFLPKGSKTTAGGSGQQWVLVEATPPHPL